MSFLNTQKHIISFIIGFQFLLALMPFWGNADIFICYSPYNHIAIEVKTDKGCSAKSNVNIFLKGKNSTQCYCIDIPLSKDSNNIACFNNLTAKNNPAIYSYYISTRALPDFSHDSLLCSCNDSVTRNTFLDSLRTTILLI